MFTPVLTPNSEAIGILRYPTKLFRQTPEPLSTSILTHVKNRKPRRYHDMIRHGNFLLVLQMHTTINSEKQQDEILMVILKARTQKTCPCREYGPVKWYGSPLDREDVPVRFSPKVVCKSDKVSFWHVISDKKMESNVRNQSVLSFKNNTVNATITNLVSGFRLPSMTAKAASKEK